MSGPIVRDKAPSERNTPRTLPCSLEGVYSDTSDVMKAGRRLLLKT